MNNLDDQRPSLEALLTRAALPRTRRDEERAEFGANEITETRKRSLFLRFLNQLTHFLALLLWFAALLWGNGGRY